MKRCPTCGRGGRRGELAPSLPAPALLTLAAEAVADGEDMEDETIGQLLLLRKALRRAADAVDRYIDAYAQRMIERRTR